MKTIDELCEGVTKIRKTILSCKTYDQLFSTQRMLINFKVNYDTREHEFNEICVQLNELINAMSRSVSIANAKADLDKAIRHSRLMKNCNPN